MPLPPAVRRLVAFLSLHDRALQRMYVAGNLWPDSDERRAAASLRSALWRLRRAACPLVATTGGQVSLDRSVTVDLEALVDVERVVTPSSDPVVLTGLIACYEQDLLPDWYEQWLVYRRERWRQVRLHALESISRVLSSAGHHRAAVDAGLAAVSIEPLRESTHRTLIEAHLAEGNQTEALRQYEQYRDHLASELDLLPSPRLTRLLRQAVTAR